MLLFFCIKSFFLVHLVRIYISIVVTQVVIQLKKSLALFKDQLKLWGYKFG